MTEYWVSQGNKWCDFCKIFISNNPSSIRNHELGQRHKESVSKRLTTMREEKVAKDKEKKEAERVLEQIEAKASRSYQKDISTFKEARESNANALAAQNDGEGTAAGSALSGDWEYESSSGYYYNQSNGCYYDPNSGFYYTDALGKWVTQEEALAASKVSISSLQSKPIFEKASLGSESKKDSKQNQRVASGSMSSSKSKAAPSSLTINKRKRQDEKKKPKVISPEEAAALKAREAARRRVEEREKSMLGLYNARH